MISRKPMIASILMVLLPTGVRAQGVLVDRIEASVNSALVFRSDVDKFRKLRALREQLDPLFGGTPVAMKGESASDAEITEFLVEETLISQAFPVGDGEVEQEINLIQANNHIDRAGLKAAIREQGFEFSDYFDLIRSSTSKRNLIDRDIVIKVSISDEDVKNYYFNKVVGRESPELSYRVRIITFSRDHYKSAQGMAETAQKALKEIRAGEPFEEVAKRVSDDPSAASGGDLGSLGESQMSPLVRERIRALKIGETSDVFGEPEIAFHVIKLVDVSSAHEERFETMRAEIRNQLTTSEYQHQIFLWLERQRATAFIHRAGEPSVPGIPR